MADKVKGLIAVLAPAPICDECIVEKLGLAALHQASHRARELAGSDGFERAKDHCAFCGEARMVTRRAVR